MRTLLFAATVLAGGLFAPLPLQEPPPAPPPAGEGLERRFTEEELERYTPREALRRRLERELQGVWRIVAGRSPEFTPESPFQGYFIFYEGYAAYTITTSARDRLLLKDWDLFQSGVKRYRVSEGGGILFQPVMGVSNLGTPGSSSVGPQPIEERELFFEADTMRISRGFDDYLSLQRVPTEAPEEILPAPRRRVLIPPTPKEPPATEPKKPG